MNSRLATVNKVLTGSFVDGPGNRLVLFLQGCNFACQACHNPYTIGICDHCGDCVPACEPGALTFKGGNVLFDAGLCDQCDACLDICPISASPMTSEYSVDDILAIIRQHKVFLTGVTVSGGEATLQAAFVAELFTAIKADPDLKDLTCFIDSNGYLATQDWQLLLPVTDGVMLDIKAFDTDLHTSLTGHDNDLVLRSAQILNDAGKLYEIRALMIPGQTDSDAEIAQFVDFIQELGSETRVRLNAFQHHGVRGSALDLPVMSKDRIDAIVNHLMHAGIRNIQTPALYQ
jgi:pyruvate formate lyase activating enzyme